MATVPLSDRRSSWLLRLSGGRAPLLRLVAFPYAGGGASVFRRWARDLPANVELFGVQFPGREDRLREPLHYQLPDLIGRVLVELEPCLADGAPYVLFGHSLGALVAFEIARGQRSQGRPGPAALIVSGRTPPQILAQRRLHTLPNTELLREIQKLDGIPAEILDHREILDLMLPALRADLALDETHVYVREPPLDCPILALGGLDDPEVSPADLSKWEMHTRSGFSTRFFSGGHFFIRSSHRQVTSDLAVFLASLTATP